MRNPIMVKTVPVDEDKVEQLCAEVVGCYDRYLDHYPSKTYKSMHAVMGPVSRVLDLIKVKGASAEHAVGFALRMHEMNPRAAGYVSREAVAALEEGTQTLQELIKMVPAPQQSRALERIRYALYYRRRKKGLEWINSVLVAFAEFARDRGVVFSPGTFPKTEGSTWGEMDEQQREVVRAFWEQRSELERAEAETDEEEEASR